MRIHSVANDLKWSTDYLAHFLSSLHNFYTDMRGSECSVTSNFFCVCFSILFVTVCCHCERFNGTLEIMAQQTTTKIIPMCKQCRLISWLSQFQRAGFVVIPWFLPNEDNTASLNANHGNFYQLLRWIILFFFFIILDGIAFVKCSTNLKSIHHTYTNKMTLKYADNKRSSTILITNELVVRAPKRIRCSNLCKSHTYTHDERKTQIAKITFYRHTIRCTKDERTDQRRRKKSTMTQNYCAR